MGEPTRDGTRRATSSGAAAASKASTMRVAPMTSGGPCRPPSHLFFRSFCERMGGIVVVVSWYVAPKGPRGLFQEMSGERVCQCVFLVCVTAYTDVTRPRQRNSSMFHMFVAIASRPALLWLWF